MLVNKEVTVVVKNSDMSITIANVTVLILYTEVMTKKITIPRGKCTMEV